MASGDEFWQIIEADIMHTVPSFIKFAFNISGYSNSYNMINLDENDISSIEKNVREEGLWHATKIMQHKLQCQSDVLLQEDQLIDCFGEIYATNSTNFRFAIGDKKLIRSVRDHMIQNRNEKGAKYMRRFRKKPDRKNRTDRAPKNKLQLVEKITVTNDVLSPSSSASLLERLKTFMKSVGIDDSTIQNMTENSVSVKVVGGKVKAEIFCALCQNDTAKKRNLKGKKVFFKNGKNSKYWVLSNYKEHLKTVHKMACNESIEENDEFGNENEDPDSKKHATLLDTDSNTDSTSSVLKSIAHEQNIEKLALAHNFSYEYVDVIESDDMQNSNTPQSANGQNQLIFDQISVQIGKMLSAVLSNDDDTEQVEFEAVVNKAQTAEVAKINPNGACAFGSLAHQLYGHQINSAEHIQTSKQMRVDVVNHISSHYSSFTRQLQGRVHAEINSNSIEDMDKECKIILNDYLPLDYYWAGAESLEAVREMYQVNILVLNERGTCHFFDEFNEQYKRTLILAFRLEDKTAIEIDLDSYNHYDSVYDISSVAILQMIELFNIRKQKKNIPINDTL